MLYDQGLTHRLYRLVQDGDLMLYQFTRIKDCYETACHLSQGPHPDRAAHWERRAANLRRKIQAMINGDEDAKLALVPIDPVAHHDEKACKGR